MSWPVLSPVRVHTQPPPQPVDFSSPHHVGYQMTAQQQPTVKYQSTAQPTTYQPTAQPTMYQSTAQPTMYQPTAQPTMYQPTAQPAAQYQSTAYQPAAQPTASYPPTAQPTTQYQQRQKSASRNSADSKPPVLPKNLEFDGKTNWTLFKQKFESYASAAGWNDEKKTDMLIWGLKGKAADFYVLLNNMNEDLTYKHLMSEFGKRFKREELPETLQARFQNECQEEGEALRDWADRILTLAAKAYKDLSEARIRRHAIIRFCMGCLDREAGQHACIQQPKTFDEAMDKIEWFRCITKTTKSKSVPSKSSKSDSSVNAYQCKTYGYYGTNSSEDEDDEEEDYVPLRKVNTRWKNSPPSILKRDTGAFAKSQPSPTENPQSGAQENAIAEMAKQMSKMSTEISSLGSKFSDLNSGLTKMLQEISHSRSLSPRRYNCFTCGSHLHFAKDCPSKLSRSPEEKTLRFQDVQPKANGTKSKAGSSPQ